ncbi:Lysine-specific demethylase 5B [Schistosoma japonicum]|nr:Lysine-specific demethylase 5B [Schistosoma japonicum]
MPSDFIRPPPAPVFNPTPEEFTDPISYVQRISPTVFNYGICKIRPPNGWKPPFSVDQHTFTFIPRVQELSDVCAYNRVRYHFITSLINFWEAQDIKLFVPQIKGKSIDIYRLWKQVKNAGGYQTVCDKKLWCRICEQISLPAVPSFASALCLHYKKYLLPYDTFIADELVNNEKYSKSSHTSQSRKKKPPVDKMVCSVCNLGNDDKYLLLCDGCETSGACHTYCLDPPLSDVPKGSWYCRSCIIRRYKQLNQFEAFGFKSSNVKYTLHSFGIRADNFKVNHFGKPTYMVSLEEGEAEFWRLVDSENTEVSVEYGADLNAREHGSGFPTSRPGRISQKLRNYVTSPWNLNNTPLLDSSALRFLPRDISGMIFLVQLCTELEGFHGAMLVWRFPVFVGIQKTIGVTPLTIYISIRSEVPELFVNSPDLLHHMTTMVSPSRLQAHGVPVYRTDQMAGEFVVTFPRAFHAGFNQGFNFAEAVNFCPADWLDYGRNCIEHYALLHRTPVFSHAELLCRMARSVEPLSVEFLTVISKQLGDLLTTERSLRRHLARIGVRLTERMVFENSDDEKRECDLCRTTLYLSSLGCKCSEIDPTSSLSVSLRIKQEHRKLTLLELNKLLKLGRARQYPSSLVERLNHMVNTICECSSVVRKLTTSYKNACYAMKNTQEMEVKSLKSELTDSGHEEDDDVVDEINSVSVSDNEAGERKAESKQNTNLAVHDVLHTSTSTKSSSETDDENSIEDSRNSTNSRRISKSSSIDEDHANDTEKLKETTGTDQHEQKFDIILRDNNNNLRSRSRRNITRHYTSSSRTRNKSKGPLISKLTLNEFASLVKLASNLPVVLPEYKELQEFANHITTWRSEVRDLLTHLNKKPDFNENNVHVIDNCTLSASTANINDVNSSVYELQLRSALPSVQKVEEYINVGTAVDIELPELNQLRRVHECLAWLEEVNKVLNGNSNPFPEKNETELNSFPTKPTLSYLCELQIQGTQVASAIAYVMNVPENVYSYNFSSHSLLDSALTVQSRHLLKTISTVKLVEGKLQEIIKAKPGSLSLTSVKEQLLVAVQLPIHLPIISDIQAICEKAEKCKKQFELFAKLILQNTSLSVECKQNTYKEQQYYTESKQNETAITIDNDLCMHQEMLDEVGFGSVNSTPANWQSYFDSLEHSIQDCVIQFPQNDCIRTLLSDLNKFHEKLSKLFLQPQSTRSLLEILLPRSASALEWLIRLDGGPDIIPPSYRKDFNLDANSCPPTTYKRHTRSPHFQALTYKSLCKDNVQEFAKISNVDDWEQMYRSTYNRFVEAEVSLMHYLRSTNMRKSRAKNQDKIVYCICRQPGLTSFMLQCELCRDWVHGRCVTLPALKDSETERMRYICSRCECSLRPDLKQVLNFVSELSNLSLCNNGSNQDRNIDCNNNNYERNLCFCQFPEFVAVQLLCDRAISFIKHIQQSIASNTELKQALSDYEHFSNMTMPSINLIEEQIVEELTQCSDYSDTSQIPMNSKKLCQPVKGSSPGLASSSISPIGSGRLPCTFRPMMPHSQDYRDIDSAKTQPISSYLPTSRPRGGFSMSTNSPWKVMNSTKTEVPIGCNSSELIAADEIHSSSSSSRLSNFELQISGYKQGRRSQLSVSNNSLCTHPGEQKEAEAAEALAGLSASLNSQSSVAHKRSLGLLPTHNRLSYSNFKTDIMSGQTGNRGNFSTRKMSQPGFIPSSTNRSDSMHIVKPHHNQILSPNDTQDSHNLNRLAHSHAITTELETTKSTPCLQSTRRFYFPLSVEARKILENLIMEACLLEVHLPQTRWLWQLHLASDQETESCGAFHPFVAKLEEERLRRRILRHIQQSSQSKLTERMRTDRRKRRGSGTICNLTYRVRGRASDLAIARRYKLGRPRRLLSIRSRRSVQRPSHALGYRSMRQSEQKQFYNSSMRSILQQKGHTMMSSSKRCKMPMNKRARNLSGQLCMMSRRSGRIYRGERLIRRSRTSSNNELSDSSTSEERVEMTPISEHYNSRNNTVPYRKMAPSYLGTHGGRKRSAFRQDRLSGFQPAIDSDGDSEEDEDCATDDQVSNYDDECPATPCLHPQTGTVKWVQCEACCQWYHQICVGIHHQFQDVPNVADDDNDSSNNIIEEKETMSSATSQDIPVLTDQLVDNWCDVPQSSEEQLMKKDTSPPHKSSPLAEPPTIDAYEHIGSDRTHEAVRTSKGPTEVLLEALDVMRSEIDSSSCM